MIECLSSGFENVYDENVRLRMMPHFSHYKHDYMRNTDLYGSLKYRATERIKSAKKYVEMLSRLHDSSSKLTNVGFMALIQYITLILAIIGLVIAYTAGKGA